MPYAVPSSVDDSFGGGGGGLPHHHVSAPTVEAAAVRNMNNNSNNSNNNDTDVAAFDPSDVDKLLAGHLKELSVQDREGIAEEVSCCPVRPELKKTFVVVLSPGKKDLLDKKKIVAIDNFLLGIVKRTPWLAVLVQVRQQAMNYSPVVV